LDLHLRKQAKQSQIVPQKVRSVDSAVLYSDKRPIDQWIFSTKELHSQKTVQQVKQNLVCDVEPLMQTWPSEIEELMKSNHVLPTPEIELTLDQYTRLIMAILDVPVKEKGLIQACHAVFTLYQEFQNSDHFKAMNRV
jgi:intraflagellar transport protein 46